MVKISPKKKLKVFYLDGTLKLGQEDPAMCFQKMDILKIFL